MLSFPLVAGLRSSGVPGFVGPDDKGWPRGPKAAYFGDATIDTHDRISRQNTPEASPATATRVASSRLDVTSLRGSGVGRPEEAVDLSEPVAAAVDVDDVYVAQQAVEDRGGEDLVAGEDLGPVAHVLVGGEADRALLVARAHEAEEEVGLLAVEGPEAHFVE